MNSTWNRFVSSSTGSALLYAIAAALVVLLLQLLEYEYLIYHMEQEVFGSFVGLIFLIVGVYFGFVLREREAKSNEVRPAIDFNPKDFDLSQREAEVLKLMVRGNSNQEIADELYISLSTVKSHCSNIYQKLQVKNRAAAISFLAGSGKLY